MNDSSYTVPTKEKIRNAAVYLMSQNGYEQVSMRMIANEVGIQVGAIYNHYPSKADILESILEWFIERYPPWNFTRASIAEMLKTQSPADILRQLVMHDQDQDDTFRMQLYRLLYMEQFNNQNLRSFVFQYFFVEPRATVKRLLDIFVELQVIPATNTDMVSLVWQRASTVYGFWGTQQDIDQRILGRCVPYLQMVEFLIESIVRGVQPVDMCAASFTAVAPPKLSQLQEQPASTSQKLILSASYLIDEVGGDKVTMRQICERVGIQAGSAYNHFAGKEGLLQAVAENIISKSQSLGLEKDTIVQAFRSGDLDQIVVAMAGCNAPLQIRLHLVGYRIIFREQYRDKALRDFFWSTLQQHLIQLSDALDQLVAEHTIAPCSSMTIATIYVYAMASIHISCCMIPGEIDKMEEMRQEVGRWILGLVLHGYIR